MIRRTTSSVPVNLRQASNAASAWSVAGGTAFVAAAAAAAAVGDDAKAASLVHSVNPALQLCPLLVLNQLIDDSRRE